MIRDGGSAWESNPPGTVLAPHTGFEVREPHQPAAHFHIPGDHYVCYAVLESN